MSRSGQDRTTAQGWRFAGSTGVSLTEVHAVLVVPLQESEQELPQVAGGLPWDASKIKTGQEKFSIMQGDCKQVLRERKAFQRTALSRTRTERLTGLGHIQRRIPSARAQSCPVGLILVAEEPLAGETCVESLLEAAGR